MIMLKAPSIFELWLFLIQLVTIGTKLKRLKMSRGFFCGKDGSSLLENSLNLGSQNHSFGEL